MNRKIYWKIRKRVLSILFKCKGLTYKSSSKIKDFKDYAFVGLVIIKKAAFGLIKGLVMAFILLALDRMILNVQCSAKIDAAVFVTVIIGCISMAGVILGLYCSNISSIYSSKYANASKEVLNAFQNDQLTQRCIGIIIDYIIFGLIIIVEMLIHWSLGYATAGMTIVGSVVVIISYSIAGNRAYQLADVYNVAGDSYSLLYRIITHNLNKNIYSRDMSFQNHFRKVSEHQIEILNEIQRFGETLQENNNAAMVRFMCNNIALVAVYWRIKRGIDRDSYWYRNTQKYQKWHLTSDIEASAALHTRTSLRSKEEHDYWWFEDEIFSINRRCIIYLCKANDYSSLYKYLLCFGDICNIAVRNKEVDYFVKQTNYLRELVEKLAIDTERNDNEENKSFAGIVELISLLHLNVILEASNYYEKFEIKNNISETINILDKGKTLNKCGPLRGNEQLDFYNKIITEIQVEKKRLTPDWLIAQNVAKEAYVYINILEDIIRESIDNVFKLGQYFYNKELFFEACIILIRFYDSEPKLLRFIEIIEDKKEEFSKYHVDSAMVWEEPRTEKLEQTIEKWKKEIPTLLFQCSSEFAFKTWEMRDEYPDFLGGCYNHICEDAIEAIVQNDHVQFRIDFENLSKLMLLYQEYIRTDFLKHENMYRMEFAYYMFTSPIVEWAQIGGLAILWGEFNSNQEWRSIVDDATIEIFNKNTKGTEVAEKIIEHVQNRDKFWGRVGNRGVVETGRKQKVAEAIRKSEKYQIRYGWYGTQMKTDSKLLRAFCYDFDHMGFTNDPSEVYWVLCINPMLSDEKKFHTKYSWEEKINE